MSKPYHSPAIIEGLKEIFFSGARSYVSIHIKWFVVKRGKKKVLEVTKAMVALVATGVGGWLLHHLVVYLSLFLCRLILFFMTGKPVD